MTKRFNFGYEKTKFQYNQNKQRPYFYTALAATDNVTGMEVLGYNDSYILIFSVLWTQMIDY